MANWLAGRKTMVGGCMVIGAGLAGVYFGTVSPVDGVSLVGAGLAICGLSAKANRHQAEIVTALGAIAQAGVELRKGDREAAQRTAQAAAASILSVEMPEMLAAAADAQAAGAAQAPVPASVSTPAPVPAPSHTPPVLLATPPVTLRPVPDARTVPEPEPVRKGVSL